MNSRNAAIILIVLVSVISGVVLSGAGLSERQITAMLLISGALVFVVGGILFTGRAIWKWQIGRTF